MLSFTGPAAFAAAGPISLTFVTSEGNNSVSNPAFSMPGTAVKGDIAFLFGRYIDTALVVPVGWTALITFYSADNGPMYLCYRIVQTGDGAFQHTPGKSSYAQMIAVFRPDVPISNIAFPAFQQDTPTTGDPAAIVIPAPGLPAVVLACYQSSALVSPRSFTPTKDGEQSAGTATNLWLAWKVYNGLPASVTIDMEDEGDLNTIIGGYVEVH